MEGIIVRTIRIWALLTIAIDKVSRRSSLVGDSETECTLGLA